MDDPKRKKAQSKAYLSKSANQICKVLDEETESLSAERLDYLISDFEQKLETYDDNQRSYELTLDDEAMIREIEFSSDYRQKQTDILIRLRETRAKLNLESTRSNLNESSTTHGPGENRSANLPKLSLPTFNGDLIEFQSFWDRFNALIDVRADLSSVNKFSYLLSLLRGDAKACLQGLALTDSNYESAKEILMRRFGRKDKIIVAHIQKLLNISSKDSLWSIYDQIQINVRSLENLGVKGDNYGLVLTPMILHRLPSSVRLEWARSSEGKEGDVENLLSFLFEEIQRRERSCQLTSEDRPATYKPRPTGSALVSTDKSNNKSKSSRICVFCGQNHFNDQCPEIIPLTHEERKGKVRSLHMCFKCLAKNHRADQCSKQCYFCKGPHHSILHVPRDTRNGSPTTPSIRPTGASYALPSCPGAPLNCDLEEPRPDSDSDVVGGAHYAQSSASGKATLMQVVNTCVNGEPVTVLFDSGSDFSYIRQDTAKRLCLENNGSSTSFISSFGGRVNKQRHLVYELQLDKVRMTLLSQKAIATPLFRASLPCDLIEQFKDIKFSEDLTHDKIVKIDILIGLDYYHEFMGQARVVRGGLVAQRTLLGWILSGSYPAGSRSKCNFEFQRQTSLFSVSDPPSEATIRNLWELSAVGIVGEGGKEDPSQCKIFEDFAKNVHHTGERYVAGLPWKGEDMKAKLVNNENLAKKRLISLEKRLSHNADLRGKYQEIFVELEKKEMIEEVPAYAASSGKSPVFYLPHRPVIRNESTTTKVRPVFDASAKGDNGVSLNDCVEVGPRMIPDLTSILLRFRRWRYGLAADIQKAFLQIELPEEDRDVHRFLLFDINNQVKHMRFRRVTFGVSCSPFMLNATIKLHLNNFETDRTINELGTNLYVDDWLTGSDCERELSEMISKSADVMKRGGFLLTKWISNSPRVKEFLGRKFDYHECESQKLLGLAWNPMLDIFHFDTQQYEGELFTKRSLLGLIARQFDPLGLLTPFTVSLKILFQKVWKSGYEWDEILPREIQDEINIWVSGLESIRKWEIPRRLINYQWRELKEVELLVFVDASEQAYGTCIYLSCGEDKASRRLVISKVRVAPLKKITLPRLELLSALLGARLLKFVREALELPSVTPYTCYTDSSIALGWIKGEACRWKQFVRNRVEEIQTLTSPSQWRHCPGKKNPADLLTRGVKADVLVTSSFWLNGPDDDWPDTEVLFSAETLKELEDSIESENRQTLLLGAHEAFIEYERFSGFGKLLRVTALVLKFIERLKAGKGKFQKTSETDRCLILARDVIIKDLQRLHYHKEIEDLFKQGQVGRTSSLSQLSPYMDDAGFVRMQSRLGKALSLTFEEKHPIILPRSHVSFLLVRSQHLLLKHAGVGTLISSLRSQYWIVGARSMAKRVVKQCVLCRRFDGKSMDQVTAPLPKDRVNQAPPFAVTGIDHAGPLYCSDTGEKKFYIVLFTCAVTRALHLEMVESLSLEDFIRAFRRFVSRRSLPSIVYTDNARTFKAASATLQARLGKEVVCWKNICPLSPNWGGWWERLVRTVKSALKKSLGRQSVSCSELSTLLPEIEACVNSRPLTYTADSGDVLTPSHFLIGRGTPLTSLELENFENVVKLSSRYEFEQALTRQFWNVWRNEYLRNLPQVTAKKGSASEGLRVGSIVLIKNDNQPRMNWALGKIVHLFEGIDGKVRAAKLRTEKGSFVRSIQHLCLLEDRKDDPIDRAVLDSHQDSQPVLSEKSNVSENSSNMQLTETPRMDSNQGVTRSGRMVKPRNVLNL